MAEEKIFTIPLREAFVKSRTHRAEDASKLVRKFLIKHMKSDNVKLGKSINEDLWKRGMQTPPRKIRVHAVKEADTVYSELLGVEIKTPSKEEINKKEQKKKEKREKIKEDRKERKKMSLQEEIEEDKQVKAVEEPGDETIPSEAKVEKNKPTGPETESKEKF
ncbi:MAG: 50S ribosomal protein L31e [Candidatus Aenigmarchaeota archaeon]|nr:50S ribosomal protein L31e [Candidatus Aenigmarchaeota archaeon]